MMMVKRFYLMILMGIFLIGLGSALPANVTNVSGVFHIMNCTTINETASYVLNASISAGAGNDCLLVQVNNVTIDGRGYNITGNINITNSTEGANAFTNLTINNTIVFGNVNALGSASVEDNGGAGGSVTITNSNISTITTDGGTGGISGGDGGAVIITNSTIGAITMVGGEATYGGISGNGGDINIINSNITGIINAHGGDDNDGAADGGAGGDIIITKSDVMDITASGGEADNGGNAGSITLTNSTARNINAIGGDGLNTFTSGNGGNIILMNSLSAAINTNGGGLGADVGGNAGSISLTNSNATTINAQGGFGVENGGTGGSITITNSTTGAITTTGGEGLDTYGGAGGAVIITNSDINLTNIVINIIGGIGAETNGTLGTLKLNQTSLYNSFGAVKFSYVSTNETNFTKILNISKNLAYVNSSNYVAYNVSANVTLLDTNVTGTDILKDGVVVCSDCTMLSVGGDDYVFNVTSWSNYSITDATGPVVYLFPVDNSSSKSRTFIYNVSDTSNISSCTLYISGLSDVPNATAINKSINNSFAHSNLAYSTSYNISVSCEDEWGNGNYSNNVTFSVGAEPVVETTTSSGSSGGVLYNVDSGTIKGSFPKNLDVSIKINGAIHKLKVLNLTNQSVFFVLRSEPQNVSLRLGESKVVTIDSSKINITLTKVSGNVAYMNISKVVVEDVIEGETEVEIETPEVDDDGKEEEGLCFGEGLKEFCINYKTWGAILLIVVLFVIVIGLATKHHKVKKHRKSLDSMSHYGSKKK